MSDMRIGITGLFGQSPRRDIGFIRAYAQAAEGIGFHSMVVPEHVVFFASYESKYPYTPDGSANWSPDTGLYDPLFVCQAGAAATTELRFMTGVLILPQRPALLTAKEVLTLDHFSGGRFDLGVGSGWSWEEYEALGTPFDRRGKRMDEYVEAMRAVWTDSPAAYRGEFVSFEDAVMHPMPLRQGGPAIIVGGDSKPAMRRAARMGDGWYGWWAQPDLEAHLALLHDELAAAGRAATDDDFSVRLGMPLAGESPDEVSAKAAEARALGIDELIVGAAVGTRDFETTLQALYDSCHA